MAIKLWSVPGNTFRLDGGAMFGNAPKALWKKWTEADALNRIPLAGRALALQTEEGRNILFETGIGTFFAPDLRERYAITESEHSLLNNLKRIGLEENDIDAVVLSHLHFDHAGGLLSPFEESPPRLLFPKATYYVGKAHWERAQNPHLRERISFIPLLHTLLQASGRLVLLDPYNPPEIGIPLSFHVSNGHTMGLLISEIALPQGPLLFVSDLVPGLPWMHLPITMGYDRFAEMLVDEKKTLFEMMLEKNAFLFFTHDPEVACARLKIDPSGKYYGETVPLSSAL